MNPNVKRYTHEDLRNWGASLDREMPKGLGETLLCYADDWCNAIAVEREACASKLNLTRSEVSLMAGELSASEWRTIAAVLKGLQARIRNNE